MLSLGSQGRSIQNHKPTAWPSRLMRMTLCRDGCGGRYAYTTVVGTCLRHVLLQASRAEARPTTPTRGATGKPAPRGIGGSVQKEASIEGVRFRCRLQDVSRPCTLLTHRNLRHAGRRLKRALRFRKFFGYFLPKNVTTRTTLCSNTALRLRHGMGRDAPVLCLGLKPRRIKE